MLTLMNTSILTNFGKFDYLPISLAEVRQYVSLRYRLEQRPVGTEEWIRPLPLGRLPETLSGAEKSAAELNACNDGMEYRAYEATPFQSAIGHQATAEILTELLGIPIAVNRISYSQGVGEKAIVFKLRGRAPEGVILTREQIDKIGYDFGLLIRFE